MSELCYQPATQLRQQLLNKSLSAHELLAEFERQINRYNPAVNALVTLGLEQAYQAAQRADDYLAKVGEPIGVLHGLPLAVKDIFHVKGMRTTFGNPHFKDLISDANDLLVQREKAAGAVIVGKSNTPDCASGGVTTNDIFGLTRNPWNPQKTTSGSGGGGAAALVAGLVSLADGSDVGGSVRTPGGWCNCVGFRPSSGRIPDAPGKGADGSTSTAGVFTRCIEDVVLFMQAVDGPNLHSAVPYPVGYSHFDATQLRSDSAVKVGWVTDFAGVSLPSDMVKLMEEARKVLLGQGIAVETVDLRLGDEFRQLYADVNACAVVAGLPEPVLEGCLQGKPTRPSIRASIERYLGLSPLQLMKIAQDVARFKVRMQLLMQQYPILALPTNNGYAFDVDDAEAKANHDWSTLYLSPMLGLPAVSVPAGFTDDGMPFGLMLTARSGEDMQLLQLAYAYERETQYYLQQPAMEWATQTP